MASLRFDKLNGRSSGSAGLSYAAIVLRLSLCGLAGWAFASMLQSVPLGRRFGLVAPKTANGSAVPNGQPAGEASRSSTWSQLLSKTLSRTQCNQDPELAAEQAEDVYAMAHAYKYFNNSWRMPMDFLLWCDNFYPDSIPVDHPMKLHQLFGPNASAAIDAKQTAQLLHAAADYRAAKDGKALSEPAQYFCPQVPVPPPRPKGRPRIAIVLTTTMAGGSSFYDKFGEKSLQNKREYAERHGYDMHVFDNGLAAPRHQFLGSVLAVMSALRFYDWIFKMDMDAIIMEPSLPLEVFVDPRYDLIGAVECYIQFGIQAGVYMIRNTSWSHMFLLEVFTHGGEGIQLWDILGDQALMKVLLFDYWHFNIRNHLKVVSPKFFNCYMHMSKYCPWGTDAWEEGDFIAHTTGEGPKGINKELYTSEYFAILDARPKEANVTKQTAAAT